MSNYLAVDPGAGRTDTIGYAVFDFEGSLIDLGQLTFEDFSDWLEEHVEDEFEKIICEDYRIRRDKIKSHVGSRVETIQTIGVIRAFARRKKIEIVFQEARILGPAQLHFGIKIPTDHSQSHRYCALLHGMEYLHSIGKAKTVLEKEYETHHRKH
jgi:hypothetical protein